MSYLQVVTTLPTKVAAQKLAVFLVGKKLTACVQVVGPIQSVYKWKGKIEEASEYLCIIKTKSELYPLLERAILKLHPYEVPEILAIPIIRGHKAYLSWLAKEVRKR